MNEQRKLSRQKIILTPSDSSLEGKINSETEHCHILLDSSVAGFTVTLPSVTGTMQRELIFKNIGANSVKIQAMQGQYIDESTSHVLAHLDLVDLWPDDVKTWWMLDNNH